MNMCPVWVMENKMTNIVIPEADWLMKLADAIEDSMDGDVIIVSSEAKQELGQSAKDRMCPDKNVTIVVGAY